MQTSLALGLMLPALFAAASPLVARQQNPLLVGVPECTIATVNSTAHANSVNWVPPDDGKIDTRRVAVYHNNEIAIGFLTLPGVSPTHPRAILVESNFVDRGDPTLAQYRLTKDGPFVLAPRRQTTNEDTAKCVRYPAKLAVDDHDPDVVLVYFN